MAVTEPPRTCFECQHFTLHCTDDGCDMGCARQRWDFSTAWGEDLDQDGLREQAQQGSDCPEFEELET
ncbi:MAG: hypothetical protein ACPGQD_03420 [Planctomycetota bacterium]